MVVAAVQEVNVLPPTTSGALSSRTKDKGKKEPRLSQTNSIAVALSEKLSARGRRSSDIEPMSPAQLLDRWHRTTGPLGSSGTSSNRLASIASPSYSSTTSINSYRSQGDGLVSDVDDTSRPLAPSRSMATSTSAGWSGMPKSSRQTNSNTNSQGRRMSGQDVAMTELVALVEEQRDRIKTLENELTNQLTLTRKVSSLQQKLDGAESKLAAERAKTQLLEAQLTATMVRPSLFAIHSF